MFKDKFDLFVSKLRAFHHWPAVIIALLVLIVAIGVVQASSPDRSFQPPHRGGWEMPSRPWWPAAPVPMIHIIAVEENVSVTIETENMPENEEFMVTMGFIYTRGKDGVLVGGFNSGDGSSQEHTFKIPEALHDQYRIAIRAQTDHLFPYYAFNWFYNNSTNDIDENDPVAATTGDEADSADETGPAIEVMQPLLEENNGDDIDIVPSFVICKVAQNDSVGILTSDFPEAKLFTVKMGIMPDYPQAEHDYDGKMKPRNDMDMGGMHGKPPHPMPPMSPPGKKMPMEPTKIWIPYYEAGTFESGEGGQLSQAFAIPSELTGAYRISIMMYSDDAYPFYSYNWFYNNDAVVECVVD